MAYFAECTWLSAAAASFLVPRVGDEQSSKTTIQGENSKERAHKSVRACRQTAPNRKGQQIPSADLLQANIAAILALNIPDEVKASLLTKLV
jgi:hypothetical protein